MMEPQEYDCQDGLCPVCEDRCLTIDDNPAHTAGQSIWWMHRCRVCGEIWAYEDRPYTEQELKTLRIVIPDYSR